MANERGLICAVIHRAWLDAQSETPGIALPARSWLLNGANGWLDELNIYHDVTRLVKGLEPLPQASFYEMAWDGWQCETTMMVQSMPEIEPEPVEIEPESLSVGVTGQMVARVCGWANVGGS